MSSDTSTTVSWNVLQNASRRVAPEWPDHFLTSCVTGGMRHILFNYRLNWRTKQQDNELYNHWQLQRWGKTPMVLSDEIITVCCCPECEKCLGEITWCWQWLNTTTSLHSSSSVLGLGSSRNDIPPSTLKPLKLNSTESLTKNWFFEVLMASMALRGASIQWQWMFQWMWLYWTTSWMYCKKVRNK